MICFICQGHKFNSAAGSLIGNGPRIIRKMAGRTEPSLHVLNFNVLSEPIYSSHECSPRASESAGRRGLDRQAVTVTQPGSGPAGSRRPAAAAAAVAAATARVLRRGRRASRDHHGGPP